MARIIVHKTVEVEVKVEVSPAQRLLELEKLNKQLTQALVAEKKDCIQALRERDANGKQWRHYQMLCNAAGIQHMTVEQARKLNFKD